MKETKLKNLFRAAQQQPAPIPPQDFAGKVMRSINRAGTPGSISVVDQLSEWFPRLAWGALAAIGICLALDFGLSAAGAPDPSAGAAQISSEWLLP